jgi:glycosyltransferase involved in cell wall biosynthesis
MKLSICITLYKSDKYFKKIFKWIEDYSIHFEFLVIDDASLNFTNSEFYKLALLNKIKVFSKTLNKGVSNSRNLGIKNASSDFILFVDADDEIDFTQLIESLKILNNDVTIFDFKKNLMLINVKRDFNNYSEALFNPIWNKVYSLSFLKKNDFIFNENLFIGEDLEFNLRVLEIAKISFSSLVFYHYDDSVINSLSKTFDNKAFSSYLYLFDYFYGKINFHNNLYKDLHLLSAFNLLRMFSNNPQFKSKIILILNNSVKLRYLFGSLQLIKNRFLVKLYYFFIVIRFFLLIDIINHAKKTIKR